MSYLTENDIIRAKKALINPLIPIRYIAQKLCISRPTLYKIKNGERYADIGISPDQLPERNSGGYPLHTFLTYHDLSDALMRLKEHKEKGKYNELNPGVAKQIKTIKQSIPFIRMCAIAEYYKTSEAAIHNILSGRTFTNVTTSYNKVMKIQKSNFLNGQPFTNSSRINSNITNAMHGEPQRSQGCML